MTAVGGSKYSKFTPTQILLPPEFHDDVIKWKPFLRYWSFVRGIHRSAVNSPYKGQWRGGLMFSLFCGWVNNGEAGDLRRHRVHYDITVMSQKGESLSREKGSECRKEQYTRLTGSHLQPTFHPRTPVVGLSAWSSSVHWPNWCRLPKGWWPNVLDLTKGPDQIGVIIWAVKTGAEDAS